MWKEKKHIAILLIPAILLAVAGIYNALRSEASKLTANMLEAVEDHEHENALIYASQLLELTPSNQHAQQVIRDSGQIFSYLQEARATFAAYKGLEQSQSITPGQAVKLYADFDRAKAYIAKAKALDPRFKRSLSFAKTLHEAP